jgi:CHRD domain
MRKRYAISVMVVLLALGVALAYAQSNFSKLRAMLTGQEEVPVVLTTGNGTFNAVISKDETAITYELTYSDLESNATQAHIHLGQPNVNGGISVWLCSNLPSPPTPAGFNQPCPLRSGTVTGTITGSSIVGPASQGLTTGELDQLIRAIRDGNTYVNVHTVNSPGGEIRSQIGPDKGKGQSNH